MKYLLPLALFSSLAFAESRKIIAVIDTGINQVPQLRPYLCNLEPYNFSTDKSASDFVGHGTQVAKLIARSINPKTHCIQNIKIFASEKNLDIAFGLHQALFFANELNAAYLNLSYVGTTYDSFEYLELIHAVQRGAKVVVAAGNDHLELSAHSCKAYPACYNFSSNFYVVGNTHLYSNYGPKVNRIIEAKDGTSFSAAIFTGLLAAGLVN